MKNSDFSKQAQLAMKCTVTRLAKVDEKHTAVDFTSIDKQAVDAAVKCLRAMGETLARYDKKSKVWIVRDDMLPRLNQFLPIGEYAATRMQALLKHLKGA